MQLSAFWRTWIFLLFLYHSFKFGLCQELKGPLQDFIKARAEFTKQLGKLVEEGNIVCQ